MPKNLSPDSILSLVTSGFPGSTVEWRDLRTQVSASITNPRLAEALPTPLGARSRTVVDKSRLTPMAKIASVWERSNFQGNSGSLSWTKTGLGMPFWSRFRLAVATPNRIPGDVDTMIFHEKSIVHTAPWVYRRTRFSGRQGMVGSMQAANLARLHSQGFELTRNLFDSQAEYFSIRSPGRRSDYVVHHPKATTEVRGVFYDVPSSRNQRIGQMEELYAMGPILALNPTAPFGGGINPENCSVVSEGYWVGGRQTVLVEEKVGEGEPQVLRRYWLDPWKEYSILRCRTHLNGQLRDQIDIRYDRDAIFGWRPYEWDIISRAAPIQSPDEDQDYPGRDRLFSFASATVRAWKSSTSGEDASANNQFPNGAIFFDQIQQKWAEQEKADSVRVLSEESTEVP